MTGVPRRAIVMLLAAGWCLAALCGGGGVLAGGPALSDHEAEIREWRRQRHERLAQPYGWLSLVGLEWLKQGANELGSAAGSDVVVPGGPPRWGTIHVDGSAVRFEPHPGSPVQVDGGVATETELITDGRGEPTVIHHGSVQLYVIERGSYAVRIKDSQAPTRTGFDGVDNYPIASDWRIDGRFLRADDGETVEIGNVLGQVSLRAMPGVFEFEREGNRHRLLTLVDEDEDALWIIFADRTNGRGTYGAGRFVYSEGLPEDGRLVVDFNKAYNPPCAFTDYSTCPLPPPENRLDLAVEAGEKWAGNGH